MMRTVSARLALLVLAVSGLRPGLAAGPVAAPGAAPAASPSAFVLLDEGTAPGAWTHDWNAALAESARSGRPVFAAFSGSDWCPACQDLHALVFEQPAWTNWAAASAVLAWVDLPENPLRVPARHREINRMLFQLYGVQSFPTCLVLPPGTMRPAAEVHLRVDDTFETFLARAAVAVAPLRRVPKPATPAESTHGEGGDAAMAPPPRAAGDGAAPPPAVAPPVPSAHASPVPGMNVVCEDGVCRLVPDTPDSAEVSPPSPPPRAAGDGAVASPEGAGATPASAQPSAAPFDGMSVAAMRMGELDAPTFASWLLLAREHPRGESAPSARRSAAALLLAAFLAGLLLNFSPCVLPMIPVTLSVLGIAAARRRRGIALGAAYGLGIAIAYGALGLVCVMTGAAIGSLQSSPWFSLGAAVLLGIFALSLFGVLPGIDFSRFGSLRKPGAGGVAAAFGAGIAFALLAGACVAPVMLATLVAAVSLQAEGNALGFALPFVLGAGCGAPWALLGAGLARWMPRPGAWMHWVTRLFGALLAVLAVRYALLAASRFRAEPAGDPPAAAAIPWRTDLAAAAAEARETHRPLFVYAWATWCRACGHLSRTTFRDPVAAGALSGFVPVKVQCEDPSAPFVTELFDAVGAGRLRGLPMLAVLVPDSEDPLP